MTHRDSKATDEVSFRISLPTDLPAILALLIDDDVARTRGDYTSEVTDQVRTAFADISSDPNNELWVAVLDRELEATLHLTLIPGLSRGGMRRAQVEAVRVRADQRG